MNMEDLILELRVEEDHMKGHKHDVSLEAKSSYFEGETSTPRPNSQKNKGKKSNKQSIYTPKAKNSKKMIKGCCYVWKSGP